MFPQRRMTTDTPDGNYSQALNLFVCGEDGWVQMPSRSISLNDYMKQLIKAHNADIDTEGTPEEFDITLCEHLFDGPETIEGLLAEHYTLSWALASLRDKLVEHIDHIREEAYNTGYSEAEAQRESTPAPGKTLPQLLEQLDAGECKGIKSATAYKIAEFAREQGYLE